MHLFLFVKGDIMAAKSKLYLFEEEKIAPAVLSLSVPTIASNLVAVLYSLADTFFVGLLNNPIQTAAVSLASPVILAFNAINNLFGVGSSSMMSRALGRDDMKTLHQSSSFGFYGSLICSVIFSVLCMVFIHPLMKALGAGPETYSATGRYLLWTVILGAPFAILNVVMAYLVRAEGSTLHAAIGTMSGCFLNMILDPFFILPQYLNLQAEGAALATMISNMVAVLYFLAYLWIKRKSTYVSIKPKDFTLKKDIVLGVCNVGIPASIQNLLNVVSQMLLNNIAASYGTVAVAATGIASRASMVPLYINMGISQGVMPLIGYTYAAKMVSRFKEALKFTLKFNIGLLVAIMIVYEIFPGTIISMFINDADTVAIGSILIRGMALSIPFLATDFLAVGVFQAVGLGTKSLIMAILRKLVLEIPAMFILNAVFPLYGIGFSQLFAEFFMAIIGMYLLIRFIKKWQEGLAVHD